MEDTTTGLTLQVTDLQNDSALQDDRLETLELTDIVLEQRMTDLEAAVNGSSNPNVTGNLTQVFRDKFISRKTKTKKSYKQIKYI